MENLKFVKPERILLAQHGELREKWVQDRIAEDPSILGLGELILKDKERVQPRAGRLDLLLQHPSLGLTSPVASDASAVMRPRRKQALAHLVPRPFVRSPLALGSLAVIVAWIAAAAAAPVIAPYNPLGQDIAGRLAPPGPVHWLGTDPLGRDILSRILYGARLSIPVGVTAVGLSLTFLMFSATCCDSSGLAAWG